MSIKGLARIANPEEVEVTLSLTMKVSDWRKIHEVLAQNSEWPYWKVRGMVSDVITLALSKYAGETELN